MKTKITVKNLDYIYINHDEPQQNIRLKISRTNIIFLNTIPPIAKELPTYYVYDIHVDAKEYAIAISTYIGGDTKPIYSKYKVIQPKK